MPCVRKQGEADRPWYALVGQRDVDHVITTHELGGLLQGVDLAALAPSPYDDPLGPPGSQSGSGVLFGTTGGVMEAALRTVAEQVSGVPMERLEFEAVRGLEGVKEATVSLAPAPGSPLAPAGGGLLELHVAVANGLGAAKKLVQAVRDGSKHYDFVEVMVGFGWLGVEGGGWSGRQERRALRCGWFVRGGAARRAPPDAGHGERGHGVATPPPLNPRSHLFSGLPRRVHIGRWPAAFCRPRHHS